MLDGRGIGEERKKLVCVRMCACVCACCKQWQYLSSPPQMYIFTSKRKYTQDYHHLHFCNW